MRLYQSVRNKLEELIGKGGRNAIAPPSIADWNTKFDRMLGNTRVRVHYWPSYSNPYQFLFYGTETKAFRAFSGSIDTALEDLRSESSDQVCFHLHWLNALFAGCDVKDTQVKVGAFMNSLSSFCSEGGTLIWTIHNLQEHDRDEGEFETKTRREIVRLATAIFVHSQAAKRAVTEHFPEAEAKIRIIPHGSYISVYPDSIEPQEARGRLGLAIDDTVFLNLGFVRKYKGLSMLCDAITGLETAKLVVAGYVGDRDLKDVEAMFSVSEQTRLYSGWVADEDLQIYLNAADFVVLPYISSLTSGAALLALSFGVPVIAPALGAFPEVVEDGKTGFLYDPIDPNALRTALERAVKTSTQDRAAMCVAAYETASRMTWSSGRYTLFRVLSEQRSPK